VNSTNSWGLLAYSPTEVQDFSGFFKLAADHAPSEQKFIPVGSGRSYGDVGLNPGGKGVSVTNWNKMLSFDQQSGVLECEAGVQIRDIQALFSTRGWVSPVTPGTSFVSLGGAIANDVHGKNHHSMGSFGNHVLEISLVRSTGETLKCSNTENAGLFKATIGGLGLTGLILSAKVQLAKIPSAWVKTEQTPFDDIDGFFGLSKESEKRFESTVAWFDCSTRRAGRGSFIGGNHVPSDKPSPRLPATSLKFPITPPFSLINKVSLNPLNVAYYHLQRLRSGERLESMWDFYYPLDSIDQWNRAYGPKGFFQYQSVIPFENAIDATKEMISIISRSRSGSFLAVLKTFGPIKSVGHLSFPMEGVTLALDFPNNGNLSEALFRQLDVVVAESGGRLNPSKDARMSSELFISGYPDYFQFMKYRDPGISSGLSRRIFGS
jgi:FAD/FMN-containing dehydrogenase